MNILIVGAGTVGTYLAEALVAEGHAVVMIDSDREKVEDVASRLDVHGIHGEATDHALLRRAGIERIELALTLTNVDEVNLVSAMTCRRLGAGRTVARVRKGIYLESLEIPYRDLLGIDLLISPEKQTAIEIAKFLENPDALSLETFAHGQVQMRQIEMEQPCPVLGKRLGDAGLPEGVLVAAISRETELMIPSGDDQLRLGDVATVVGRPEALEQAEPLLGQTTPEPKSIVIMGGGEVGRNLALILESRPAQVTLIERDEDRAQLLSERLPNTSVICGNATQIDVMQEEGIGRADVFIATTGEDEDNIMGTVLAREMGVRQTIVLIHRPDYASIVQRMGFDHVLSPRVVTAKHLMQHIRGGDVRAIPVLGAGAEMLEFTVSPRAQAAGRPLRDLGLPRGALICALVSGGHVRVPHGNDRVEAGDTVIAIALRHALKPLRATFA